jgi:hypothetical protein
MRSCSAGGGFFFDLVLTGTSYMAPSGSEVALSTRPTCLCSVRITKLVPEWYMPATRGIGWTPDTICRYSEHVSSPTTTGPSPYTSTMRSWDGSRPHKSADNRCTLPPLPGEESKISSKSALPRHSAWTVVNAATRFRTSAILLDIVKWSVETNDSLAIPVGCAGCNDDKGISSRLRQSNEKVFERAPTPRRRSGRRVRHVVAHSVVGVGRTSDSAAVLRTGPSCCDPRWPLRSFIKTQGRSENAPLADSCVTLCRGKVHGHHGSCQMLSKQHIERRRSSSTRRFGMTF